MNVKNTTNLLEIHDLSVSYVNDSIENKAVRNLSLSIKPGEIVGLVGESGCGKSTVAMSIVKYLPAGTRVSGKILFKGKDILQMKERQLRGLRGNRIAVVYQNPQSALNPSMTVFTQMREIIQLHGNDNRNQVNHRCNEMLEMVRIADTEEVLKRYPHQLSGGMQQRVIIAMALMMKPELLIMDEPTTGLDVTIEAGVLDLIKDLKDQFSTSILFISHNLGVVARLCQRLGVMYAGELVEEAPVIDLFHQPKHPYTFGLMGCIPRKGKKKSADPLWSIPGRVPSLNQLPKHCVFAERCGISEGKCWENIPELFEIREGHRSRCFFPENVNKDNLSKPEVTQSKLDIRQVNHKDHALALTDLKVHFAVKAGMLSLRFKKQTVKALDGVTFEVPACSTVGIVGESGCGKSTMAKAISGIVPITSGLLKLGDVDLIRPVEKRKKGTLQLLQMIFQNPDSTLNPQKTVEEELRRPLRLFQITDREHEDAVISQLLTAVNLDDGYKHRYPAQLSGGEIQRVAIARAFAGTPQLVICDEPTSSLDVSVQSMVLNLLHQLQTEFGVSLIFISHDLGVVRYISDYIGVIYLGRLAEFGTAEEIFKPPYHPYTEALLSAIPEPDPTVKKQPIQLTGSVPSAITPPKGCRFHTRCPRKLGDICKQVVPPGQFVGTHQIFCHIPGPELIEQQANFDNVSAISKL